MANTPCFPSRWSRAKSSAITPAATWPATASCPSPSPSAADQHDEDGVVPSLPLRYPYGTPVTTFTGKEDHSYLLRAFAKQGEELSPAADAKLVRTPPAELKPGEWREILNVRRSGVVSKIVIEGEASEAFLHQVEIETSPG